MLFAGWAPFIDRLSSAGPRVGMEELTQRKCTVDAMRRTTCEDVPLEVRIPAASIFASCPHRPRRRSAEPCPPRATRAPAQDSKQVFTEGVVKESYNPLFHDVPR